MELKTFIQVSLEEIVEGVSNAQKKVSSMGGNINPTGVNHVSEGQRNYSSHAIPTSVEFDIGLTQASSKGGTEGIGVFLGSVSLGKKNEHDSENIAVTRVRFSVPLALPAGARIVDKVRNTVEISGL